MCITFLFTNKGGSSLKYKLILINNRDEYYTRTTQKATLFTKDTKCSIYGVDLAGAVQGTWLGISAKDNTIKIGNLANVTGAETHGKLGRGPLVTKWIDDDESIELYNEKLHEQSEEFSSFNFLSVVINPDGDIKTFYLSNTPKVSKQLPLGFVGVGNSPLDQPFKKVDEGIVQFKKVLEDHKDSPKEQLIEALSTILKNEKKFFPDKELAMRRNQSAEFFSSIFVTIPYVSYGTRTRTIILVDNEGNIDYQEETMTTNDPNGEWETTKLNIPNSNSHL